MKKVGEVTDVEKREIEYYFERSNGIEELLLILDTKDELYRKATEELNELKQQMEHWWRNMSLKYRWESSVESSWSIDFFTNNVFLV